MKYIQPSLLGHMYGLLEHVTCNPGWFCGIENLIRVPRRIVKGFVRCIGRTRTFLKMLFKAGEMFFSLSM